MAKVLYLAVEKLRQYRLIASPHLEAVLHLVCEFATHNNAFERTGYFLRFSGHPELIVQEISHAETRTENDQAI